MTWPDDPPKSAYGPMKRSISAAAGFVINGGAIIPREATPYWRGRSRYVAQFLMQLGCPILYTVHGHGVCEIGASVRMSDDFIVLMLSTDCNRDGAEQVTADPASRRLQGSAARIEPGTAVQLPRRGAGLDARERECRRSTDPAGRTGDQRAAAVQVQRRW